MRAHLDTLAHITYTYAAYRHITYARARALSLTDLGIPVALWLKCDKVVASKDVNITTSILCHFPSELL